MTDFNLMAKQLSALTEDVDYEIYGVLDIDSPEIARFGDEEKAGLEALVGILEGVLELR